MRSIENEWKVIEDPASSFGKPNYDEWLSPLQLLERLDEALAPGVKHAPAEVAHAAAHKLHDVSDAAAHREKLAVIANAPLNAKD